VTEPRVVAIDWSGALTASRRKIWLAEVACGAIARLEDGRDRAEIEAHLLDLTARDANVIIGLDFGFSMPAWFMRERGYASAHDLWADVASCAGEEWLAKCEPPFWGRPGKPRPAIDGERPTHRRCETAVRAKSMFQVGGAGAVGTASLRGMPMLHRLHQAGFHVWPYDEPGFPLLVEIYPRVLTGPARKSNTAERAAYIDRWCASDRCGATVPPALLDHARSSEDAFDALFSAIVMWWHRDELRALVRATEPLARLEGMIWGPSPTSDF
jgi:hypothetical protein